MQTSLKEQTSEIQQGLARFCRTGEGLDPSVVNETRARVYRRLVYNNIEGTLRGVYPVAFTALGDVWQAMVSDFLSHHPIQTPYMWRLSKEFYLFAKEKRLDKAYGIPYLLELLFFEWIEVEVYLMPDRPIPLWKTDGDFLCDPLILNPEHDLSRFTYPVFRVAPSALTEHAGQYFVVTFRHLKSRSVSFIELSPFFALVFEILAKEALSLIEALGHASAYFPQAESRQLRSAGEALYRMLSEQGLCLGFATNGTSH